MSFNYGLRPTTTQMVALSGGSSTQSAASLVHKLNM